MIGPFGVLAFGMGGVSWVYVIAGLVGYMTYGEEVKGSITLNLPSKEIFTIVKLMLVLVVYFGFVFQLYVVVEMIWPKICAKVFTDKINPENGGLNPKETKTSNKILFYEYLFRTCLVLLSMIIAIAVPNLEQIIPLVGVTLGMLLAFVFPACIDLMTFLPLEIKESNLEKNGKKQMTKVYRRILINTILIIIGIFGLIAGLQTNIRSLFPSSKPIGLN